MNKVYVLIVLFLASGWCFSYWRKTALENDLNNLKKDYLILEYKFEGTMQQKILLEREFEKRNQEKILLSKRMCEIEKRAEKEKDKGGFNWNNHLPTDSVTNQLRKD